MEFVTTFKPVKLNQDPGVASDGELYFNTASSTYRYYSSGSWTNIVSRNDVKDINTKSVYSFGSDTTASVTVNLNYTHTNSLLSINAIDRADVWVPNNSASPIPIGSSVQILKSGTADMHLRERGGVVINVPSSIYLNAQWTSGTLYKIEENTWIFDAEYPDIY